MFKMKFFILLACLLHMLQQARFCGAQVVELNARFLDKNQDTIRFEKIRVSNGVLEAYVHKNGGTALFTKRTFNKSDTIVRSESHSLICYDSNFYDWYQKRNYCNVGAWDDTVHICFGERYAISDSVIWKKDTLLTGRDIETFRTKSMSYETNRVRLIINSELNLSDVNVDFLETRNAFFLSDTLVLLELLNADSVVTYQKRIRYCDWGIEFEKKRLHGTNVYRKEKSDSLIWLSDSSFVFKRNFGRDDYHSRSFAILHDTILQFTSTEKWTKYHFETRKSLNEAFMFDNVVYFDLPSSLSRFSRIKDPTWKKAEYWNGQTTLRKLSKNENGEISKVEMIQDDEIIYQTIIDH